MFPRVWKKQRLVLIPKGNNTQDTPGYRPLCMIDMAGKLLERITYKRLEKKGCRITNLVSGKHIRQ